MNPKKPTETLKQPNESVFSRVPAGCSACAAGKIRGWFRCAILRDVCSWREVQQLKDKLAEVEARDRRLGNAGELLTRMISPHFLAERIRMSQSG